MYWYPTWESRFIDKMEPDKKLLSEQLRGDGEYFHPDSVTVERVLRAEGPGLKREDVKNFTCDDPSSPLPSSDGRYTHQHANVECTSLGGAVAPPASRRGAAPLSLALRSGTLHPHASSSGASAPVAVQCSSATRLCSSS